MPRCLSKFIHQSQFSHFTSQLSGEHQRPHFPIAHKRKPRIRESRRAIFLQKKMADPREGVTGDQRREQQRKALRCKGVNNLQQRERGADEMQPAIRRR